MNFTMDHIVINVVDIDVALHFYTEILDLPGERVEEFANNQVPFPSVRLSPDTIIDLFPKKLWQGKNPEQVCRPNMNHFCLSADKQTWELLRDRLEGNGISIDDGPVQRWGAHGTGTSVYFRDPDGNVIEVRYYDEQRVDSLCLLDT